ncbi:zinc finger, CCHC-type containing protein [Tanacetum coccineum]
MGQCSSYKEEHRIQKIEIIVADKPKEKSPTGHDKPKPKPKPKESDKPKGDNNDKPKASEAPPKAGDTAPKADVAKMMFEPPVDGYPQMYPMVGYGYQQQQGYTGAPFQHSGYGTPSSSGYGYNNHHGYNGNATYHVSNSGLKDSHQWVNSSVSPFSIELSACIPFSDMSMVYVLTTPMPEDGGDNPTVEQNDESSKELWDSLEAKYIAEDASSKKFLVSNFTNYKMTDSRLVLEQCNELLEELTLVEVGSYLHIKESLRVKDSDKPKRNNVAGPLVVNIVEHNNSSRYKDNKGKHKHHDNTRVDPYKKAKPTCWKCGKTSHIKKDCKGVNVGSIANGSGTKGSVDGSSNSLKGSTWSASRQDRTLTKTDTGYMFATRMVSIYVKAFSNVTIILRRTAILSESSDLGVTSSVTLDTSGSSTIAYQQLPAQYKKNKSDWTFRESQGQCCWGCGQVMREQRRLERKRGGWDYAAITSSVRTVTLRGSTVIVGGDNGCLSDCDTDRGTLCAQKSRYEIAVSTSQSVQNIDYYIDLDMGCGSTPIS